MKNKYSYQVFIIMCLANFAVVSCSSGPKVELMDSSMEPNFTPGQIFMIETVIYSELNRGDLIVFEFFDGRRYIKRLIGLPGETIEIHNGQVFINDQPVIEPYDVRKPIYVFCCITLNENEFYVLGDNRNHSDDSHTFGSIRREQIIGIAVPVK